MRKNICTIISFILLFILVATALTACRNKGNNGTESVESVESTVEISATESGDESQGGSTESGSVSENTESGYVSESTESSSRDPDTDSSETESATESDVDGAESSSVSGSESNTEEEKENLIESSNKYANTVQAYFTDGNRNNFVIENTEMALTYMRAASGDQLVSSLANANGGEYISNTMDVFVKMKDGKIYYASNSGENAQVNLYRFGYYYYEALFEGQGFLHEEYDIQLKETIDVLGYNKSGLNNVAADLTDEGVGFTVTVSNDPYFAYKNLNFSSTKYKILILTAKATGNCSGFQLFVSTNNDNFSQENSLTYSIINDGEFHTYYIILDNIQDYSGNLTGLRFDPYASEGSGIVIKDIQLGAAKLDSMPRYVSIARRFHVYSDKMHQSVQFATTQETKNVAEVGVETKIDADKVAKILIKDASGEHYSLDGIDWSSVECVGFDIIDAGIFGYIMPKDEIAGSITVTLEKGEYKIVQTRVPENNTLIPSESGTENANDFYIGSRVYTDEGHDFAELVYETYCERNPISDKRISVSKTTAGNSYLGYDAMRGIYVFDIVAPLGGFYTPYNNPNKDYKLSFQLRSDIDRDIYVMTSTTCHMLECAVLMDENMLMLPVPIQVTKNFSETNGERTLYNLDDPSFSEAIFRLSVNKDEKYSYTIINLYQNWGNYPLKQLSSIPFWCPYYHLSTGVTETNCITPWYLTRQLGKVDLNTLPDFRPMSAPVYAGQPQHHNSGAHSWLQYTDANGKFNASENVKNTITSHGPTYAEVVMEYISDDGKIDITYTHMEMPQTDENRTYYIMEYKVLEDVTINDFRRNFMFYEMTDNDNTGVYQKIGYLDENNESKYVAANKDSSSEPYYILGDLCPYFTFFEMPGQYDKESNPEGYSSGGGYGNLAFLIYNSEIFIEGEKSDANFVIVNAKNRLRLSLDLDDVTLKAGDTITINAILLPWGSHELNDGKIDVENKNFEYDMVINEETGELYMDKNVRDVRENTLLNPLKATSVKDKVIESTYIPKIKSNDGKSATFTISGGENNVVVRAYGFTMLTSPKIEELVGGEWVEYVVSSSKSPDRLGYYHYYDGYCVHYDGDGSFSYSFVITMSGGAERTFRVSADTEFKNWPEEEPPVGNENLLDVYIDAEEIKNEIDVLNYKFGEATYNQDGYVSVHVKINNDLYHNESYADFYMVDLKEAKLEDIASGQYFTIKYRVPTTNKESVGYMQVWAETANNDGNPSQYFNFNPIADGEWHVEVFDLASLIPGSYYEQNGEYYAIYLRVDIFNKRFENADTHIDLAYMGIDADLKEICALCSEEFDTIPLYSKGAKANIDTATGELIVIHDIHPDSGYTKSDVAFGANLGYVNGVKQNNFISHSANGGKQEHTGASVDENGRVYLRGWCAIDGGVSKYVWSIDGLNWFDVGGAENVKTPSSLDIATTGQIYSGRTFGDLNVSSVNAQFQTGTGIYIDLSAYNGKTVDILFAAVPANDTDTLVILYYLKSVNCTFEEKDEVKELAFGANLGSINGVSTTNFISHNKNGGNQIYNDAVVDENGRLNIRGWCAVDGGVSKYIWSIDGNTWYEVGNTENIKTPTSDDIVATGQIYSGMTFEDLAGAKTNAQFQINGGIYIDLSQFEGETVDVIFAAVPINEEYGNVVLYTFKNVNCTPNQ